MKKIILVITAIAFLFNVAIAQKDAMDLRDKVTFGLKAGANLSNLYDSNQKDFNNDARFGFAGGAFLSLPLSTLVGIQPEVLYSQKGFKATGSLLGSSYDLKRRTNYLDVPILLAIKPSPVLSLLVGPQFSFLMNGKYDFSNALISGGVNQNFENDNVRKNTLCLTGGADINLDNLVLSGRAGWDLNENNKNGTSTTPRYKNVWLQATIGFRF